MRLARANAPEVNVGNILATTAWLSMANIWWYSCNCRHLSKGITSERDRVEMSARWRFDTDRCGMYVSDHPLTEELGGKLTCSETAEKYSKNTGMGPRMPMYRLVTNRKNESECFAGIQ